MLIETIESDEEFERVVAYIEILNKLDGRGKDDRLFGPREA
jgi:hypothetical protein